MKLDIVTVHNDPEDFLRLELKDLSTQPGHALPYFEAMKELCHSMGGFGLAAPQVSLPMNFFIFDRGRLGGRRSKYELVLNPAWRPVLTAVEVDSIEGCLSIPGKQFLVRRYSSIHAEWTNSKGKKTGAQLASTAAFLFQHESDHLAGVLVSDHGRSN